ncbi:hypothetical protein MUN81_19970 [Hymenobacter sp. 5317J-9]|uniref:hypothetical protein n=1 Tax=Hymenobacter sp. 5317J-9 TaxID=2932250 RepID=UPI001FD70873|nr:hypothetical protein [Hymenobacter sp. 5317J-9]UOQ97496.1 hypothetical protein MUN81_19970 [Hymenobacter sp. 5317J-9]
MEEGGNVGEWEVVGGGEIVGFGDESAAGLVGAAFEDAAEGAAVGDGVVLGGLLINGVALGGVEADGVGVAVGSGVAGGETAGDAGVGVAEFLETLVEGALAEKFVETVVGDVVADEEHPLDVVADGGGAVAVGRGNEGDRGLATVGSAGGHDGTTVYPRLIEVVELFEGEGDYGEFYKTGGVEILLGVEVVGVWREDGTVLRVAVDLGVDDLQLVLGIEGDAL